MGNTYEGLTPGVKFHGRSNHSDGKRRLLFLKKLCFHINDELKHEHKQSYYFGC